MFKSQPFFFSVGVLVATLFLAAAFHFAHGFTNPGGNPETGTSTSMFFYSGGKIGVSTSTPSYTLDVVGDIRASSRISEGSEYLVPAGMVLFFSSTTCPTGWAELTAARGLYFVGLLSGGTLAATIGTALSNLENRIVGIHSHVNVLTDSLHTHTDTTSGLWGYHPTAPCTLNGTTCVRRPLFGLPTVVGANPTVTASNVIDYGAATVTNAITNSSSGTNISGTSGTNAPYVQLLACQKS